MFIVTQMSEDLVKQLSSYKAQLQQVEVALSTDPENEDLLKLQKDLQVCVYMMDSHMVSRQWLVYQQKFLIVMNIFNNVWYL